MNEVVIRLRENGPLLVPTPVKVLDHLGNEFVIPAGKPTVALCRCGQSKNRPFCDGSHKGCGFVANETAGGPGASASSQNTAQPVSISPLGTSGPSSGPQNPSA